VTCDNCHGMGFASILKNCLLHGVWYDDRPGSRKPALSLLPPSYVVSAHKK